MIVKEEWKKLCRQTQNKSKQKILCEALATVPNSSTWPKITQDSKVDSYTATSSFLGFTNKAASFLSSLTGHLCSSRTSLFLKWVDKEINHHST